jgi:hypothetical protein
MRALDEEFRIEEFGGAFYMKQIFKPMKVQL